MLLARCLEPSMAGTGGYLLASPVVKAAVPANKDAYVLCLVNEIHFYLSASKGGGGRLRCYIYYIVWLQGIQFTIYPLEHVR